MRAASNGFSATLLLLIPLLAVPFLAAIGLPQLSSAPAASDVDQPDVDPVAEAAPSEEPHRTGERRVEPAQASSADDLFAPLDSPRGRLETAYDEPVAADPRYADRRSRVRTEAAARGWSDWRFDAAADGEPGARAQRPSAPEPVVHPAAFEPEPLASAGPTALEPRAGGGFDDLPSSAANAPPESEPQRQVGAAGERAQTAMTWEAAVQRLEELGVEDFSLSPGSGQGDFHFSCQLTPDGEAGVTHRFEAEAAEPLAAVEDVLGQLDEWLSQTAGRAETLEGRLARLSDAASGRE